jgi:L-2,4-diaminobutyrate transaminase
VNIGYGRQEVAEAIADQARELAYYHAYVGHGTEASVTLAQMVMDRAPDHMSRSISASAGRTPTRPT